MIVKVAIVMGSDSDLPVMAEAAVILEKLGITYEMRILSAHRTPYETARFAKQAMDDGVGVIIAGAGGAAHLAGVLAAHTTTPVIGVPIMSKTLSGVDSLYSTVQMPKGVPVACVAIGGAYNAGLLAAQILSLADPDLALRLRENKDAMEASVLSKDRDLASIGYEAYLEKL